MNKRQIEKIKKDKEITYQEAWNKIAEFMNNYPQLSFSVEPWDREGILSKNKYSLATMENDKFVRHFIADKEWGK